jgi:hypothetical protein
MAGSLLVIGSEVHMKVALIPMVVAVSMALVPGLATAQTTQQTNQVPVTQQQGSVVPAQQQSSGGLEIVEHGSAEQQQLAPEPEVETRPRLGLVISGAILFGVSYVFHAALVSPFGGWSLDYGDNPAWSDFRWMGAIPLAGPWLQLAAKPTSPTEDGWTTYLVIDGLLQAAGATMLILGLTLRQEVGGYAEAEPSFMVAPMAGRYAAGLTAFGRF